MLITFLQLAHLHFAPLITIIPALGPLGTRLERFPRDTPTPAGYEFLATLALLGLTFELLLVLLGGVFVIER